MEYAKSEPPRFAYDLIRLKARAGVYNSLVVRIEPAALLIGNYADLRARLDDIVRVGWFGFRESPDV